MSIIPADYCIRSSLQQKSRTKFYTPKNKLLNFDQYFWIILPTLCSSFVPENKDFGQYGVPICGILSDLVQRAIYFTALEHYTSKFHQSIRNFDLKLYWYL